MASLESDRVRTSEVIEIQLLKRYTCMPNEKQLKRNRPGKLLRIASMGRAELTDRLRQELQKRTDSVLFRLGLDPTRREIRASAKEAGRFFFRAEEISRCLDLLRERMPQQATAIVQSAEKICRHQFDLLGYQDLDYGPEIDWHLDRVHGKRASHELWFKIRYLDFNVVGDAKVTWELNRHQHLITLAKAYRLTNDFRFASELIGQWRHWQQKNPYPWGINWASSLEVAFRSLSWFWVQFLLDGTNAMTNEFRDELLEGMALNGRHLERYLSTYFSPNTHLLGEAVALFFIGTLCPRLSSSERWKQNGWRIVLRESEHQLRPDGFHFEQSTYYHVYALDFFLHAGVLASLNEMPFPKEFNQRLERMLNVLALLCRAGTPPRWGDDDGGRLFDPQRNRAEHLFDPLATGAILFGRGDFKRLSDRLPEETLWLLGEKGVADFDCLQATESAMSSTALPHSGLYLMSCDQARLQAVIDAGPQGAIGAGHGHADALSMTLHAGGHELIGDPGAYVYVSGGTGRDQFRVTAAHNTVQLDNHSQSVPKGPFGWERLVSVDIENWINGNMFDLFVGSHDGYALADTLRVHRRWVFFRKSKFWLVRDVIQGSGEHQIDVLWHLNPMLARSNIDEHLFTMPGGSKGIGLLFSGEQSWQKTVIQDAWSAAYGTKEPAAVVRFTEVTTLPTECATLLLPVCSSIECFKAPLELTQLCSSPGVSAYRHTGGQEDHLFLFGQGSDWTFMDWKSNAEFLYCSRVNGRLELLVFCNGTYVECFEKRLVDSPNRAARCEIVFGDSGMQVLCPEKGLAVLEPEIEILSSGRRDFPESGEADR